MRVDRIVQLKPGEEIILTVHQSLIPFFPRMILFFLWIVIPFFFLFPLFRLGWAGALVFFALVVSGLLMAARIYWMWKCTMFVVTDRRIIDIDQRGLLDRTVSEVFFEGIDDVSYRVRGIVATVCRFGSVLVQTSGTGANVEITRVSNPARLHDLLNDLRVNAMVPEPQKSTHADPPITVEERDATIRDLYAG